MSKSKETLDENVQFKNFLDKCAVEWYCAKTFAMMCSDLVRTNTYLRQLTC